MRKVKKYNLIFDKDFFKKYKKIGNSFRKQSDKKILRLKEDPRNMGKPLFNVHPNLYELYLNSYRIYYVVQDSEVRVLLIAIEHKNNQQKFLNQINPKFIQKLIDRN